MGGLKNIHADCNSFYYIFSFLSLVITKYLAYESIKGMHIFKPDNHFKYQIMSKILKIYIFLLLVCLAFPKKDQSSNQDRKGKIIVQSEHFTSQTQKSIEYNLTNLNIGKSVVLHPKKKNRTKSSIGQNNIHITFSISNKTYSCELKTQTDLCIIQQLQKQNASLTLECQFLPCQASWMIYQLESSPLSGKGLTSGLYSIEGSNNHLVVYVTCNDPANQQFAEDIVLYSNTHFERQTANNKLYFLFANQQKGYLYFDIKENSRNCAHLNFTEVQSNLSFSRNLIKDFTNKHSPSRFIISKPTKDMRVDGYFHCLDDSPFEFSPVVRLYRKVKEEVELWQTYSIPPLSPKQAIIDFSLTVKQPSQQLQHLQLQISVSQQKMVIVNIIVDEYDIQEVELSERNYFTLKKGQSISFRLLPKSQSNAEELAYLLTPDKTNLKINMNNCSAKTGCDFLIEAINDISTYVYLSSSPQIHRQETVYTKLVKSTLAKIKEEQWLYFVKNMSEKKAFEIAINNPNIMLYAASKKKCERPNAECNERKGNYLHPFAYDPQQDGEFIIGAVGLEPGEFILTVIDQQDQFIHLQEGKPFSYRIQQKEEQILFKFKIRQKIDVSFNLIAPLNHLTLVVYNAQQVSEFKGISSSQGSITIAKDDIESLNFIIKIKKSKQGKNKMSHFTLIATTATSLVRLQPTVAHYQNILPTGTKEYIFQYDPSEQYILNFYTHNINSQDINIMISLSNNRVWNDTNLEKMYIDLQSDFLDLKHVSDQLCLEEGEKSCEIFLLIRNKMEVEVDITITLMTRYSIIELKDGLWESYQESTIASSAQFYFYPKHYDKNVIIIYSTVMQDLKLAYSLWKTDSKSIDPTQWPFPQREQFQNYSNTRSVNQITIDKQSLKRQCKPNCIILLSLYRDTEIKFTSYSRANSFKIMASNNQIELPQKTRINLVLQSEQSKEIMIDLKYALEKESITFYTSHTLGSFSINANIISQNHPRCPISSQEIDFQIKHGQTILDVERINLKRNIFGMQNDSNIYLCLIARGLSNSKFSLQYTLQSNKIQALHLNSFQEIKMEANQSKVFQIEGYHDFIAKIIRRSGFPYIFIKKCLISEIKECQEHTLTTKQIGTQVVHKNEEFNEEPCNQCLYLFKFQAYEPCAINLHLITQHSELQLKEHEIITDFIVEKEESLYSITHIQKEDLLVNIHAIDGDIIATFTNHRKINLIRQTQQSKKAIHFFIPKSFNQGDQKDNPHFGSFKYSSTFTSFHLSIRSKSHNTSATYSITYSSGQNEINLQDGLITDVALQPNIPYKFYYENQINKEQIHLTLSAPDQNILSLLNIKSFYYQVEGADENKVQFNFDIPKIRKKTPNPTLLLSLPEKNYFQIQVTNNNSKTQVVSIGINHQQLIILPLNHEFPFSLLPLEEINFLVDISKAGYLQAQIRKCDESEPIFSYSFQYESFIKGDFVNQIQFKEQPKFQDFIKVASPGTFYINIKGREQNSLLAINLRYFESKPKPNFLKAGNRGIIEYQFSDSKNANIFVAPVVCKDNCQGIKYYMMSSKSSQDLYSQLVCPSNFFSINSIYTADIIPLVPIKFDQSSKIIKFSYSLPHHTSYIAVKATTPEGKEIYYKPIEIVTVWGHLSRTSKTYKLTIAFIIMASICVLLLFVRHNARRGYRRIESQVS